MNQPLRDQSAETWPPAERPAGDIAWKHKELLKRIEASKDRYSEGAKGLAIDLETDRNAAWARVKALETMLSKQGGGE